MPRPRPRERGRRAQVEEWQYKVLAEEELTPEEEHAHTTSQFFGVCDGELNLRDAWELLRAEILARWVADRAGTRPTAWWTWDAPRTPDGKAVPRRRLGGTGTPAHECLANGPAFAQGIPVDWVSPWMVAYYNGLAVDVEGVPIGLEYHEGHFPYDAIDPGDPPMFESEYDYLERHGLLLPGERARCNTAVRAPEAVLHAVEPV